MVKQQDNPGFCGIYYCPNCGVMQKHIDLTAIEVEILRSYANGLSTNEIAKTRFISIKTVEAHRRSLILKTGTPNIIAAVVWGIRKKIIILDGSGNGV